jgi:photosystem II stability/assembly factor-like uncharacterized protein
MSGFDFGSLRDPDAPIPGARHREGVEMRARELRRSASRKRMLVSGLALVIVIAAVAGILATRPNPGPSIEVRHNSSTTVPAPSSSVGDRFVPPTTIENGLVVLPVTLPDGERFTLRYPPAMRIAQLGFAGGISVSGAQVLVNYTTIAHLYRDSKALATYPGANGGTVPVFQAYRPIRVNGPPPGDEMAFQFGPWLARISLEGKTGAQRATLARSLTGTVDANGYLLLHAQAPLAIGNQFDGLFGAPITGANQVEVASHLYCGQPESDSTARRRFVNGDGSRGVAWCTGALHFSATGSTSFVDLAANKLQVSSAGTPLTSTSTTTTTTTSTPTPTNAPAVSASFVSLQHGWVLENDGQVVETSDGGRTWNQVGNIGMPTELVHIRFADASRGFAFTTVPGGSQGLVESDDGGVHWKQLQTPFSSVSDLAISRGVVYVVGIPSTTTGNGAFPGFRIWSSPADHLQWSMDPLNIPTGAGPVPRQQLVFAGSRGWMVNNDRDVISGARLSPSTGHWTTWTPPCQDVGGPASLTASTSNDLVAVCGPAFATSSTTTRVEFSHDGGSTFQRHALAGSGEVGGPLSPDPDTAVIVAGNTLQRSTDDGATWQVVDHVGSTYGASDLGFTSSSQGFVIFSDGTMLMTYDAGATWSAVTPP